MKKLQRAVIKEELVALTGDFKLAVTLNQMIYWSERTDDRDKFLRDEINRSGRIGKLDVDDLGLFSHGWIYKTAEELSEETMMGVSKSTMGRYLAELIEKGWLSKRKNPKWKGDNTSQYRVDLVQIQLDLNKLGYALEGYSLLQQTTEEPSGSNKFQNETPCFKIEQPVAESNRQFQNETTLPEITSKITSKITNKELKDLKELVELEELDQEPKPKIPKTIYKDIVDYLNFKANTKWKPTTKETRELIKHRLDEGFVLDDFKTVIDVKVEEWANDGAYAKYLRPKTLFSPKFEGYLNQKKDTVVLADGKHYNLFGYEADPDNLPF